MKVDAVGNAAQIGDIIYRHNAWSPRINMVIGLTDSGNLRLVGSYNSSTAKTLSNTGYTVMNKSFIICKDLTNLDQELKDLFNEKRKELGLEPIK